MNTEKNRFQIIPDADVTIVTDNRCGKSWGYNGYVSLDDEIVRRDILDHINNCTVDKDLTEHIISCDIKIRGENK